MKGKFAKGKMGNPEGRPKGARNRSSLLAEQLFIDEVENICQTVITEAKAGNIQAAKLILDRLLPARKDSPIEIDLPIVRNSSDILNAIGCITNVVGSGHRMP